MRTRGSFGNEVDDDAISCYAANIDGGHDFWSLVDSTPSAYAHRACRCAQPDWTAESDCAYWPHLRDAAYCLAARSDGGRCAQHAADNTPFCEFHLERAWEAMQMAALHRQDQSYRWRLASVRKEQEDQTRAMIQRGQLEQALGVDAAAAQIVERVYFFLADGCVKIGRSLNPERRVKTLGNTLAPVHVKPSTGSLLGTIVGGCSVEGLLHARFARHRIVGEWFEYEPIAAGIDELIAGAPVDSEAAS